MRTPNFISKLLSAILLTTILAGCSVAVPGPTSTPAIPVTGGSPTVEIATSSPTPTLAPTSTPQPTIDYTPTLNAARTEAVATAFAGLTQTAQAEPTRTLAPLWTLTPTLNSTSCTVTSVSPDANSPLKPNGGFDGKWEVKNTGDGSWNVNETDIRYVSGTKFQTKHDVIDLSSDVPEDSSTTIIVDMQAPAAAGTYVTNWAIYRGSQVVCGLGLTIRVQP